MRNVNALMVGVGGQGVVLASDIMAEVGMNSGYDVKKSDSLGMSQRGGSVVSHVRWGQKVFSPMVKQGEVDFLLGFEQLEAARWAPYLKPGGVAIVADVVIVPVSVIGSSVPYPNQNEVKNTISRYSDKIYFIPANRIGLEVGNPRALNMVMLGCLSVFLGLEAEAWTNNICQHLNANFVRSSLEAFSRGAAEARAMTLSKAQSLS
ncbi:MAG: indolepyruvate oxidoreductase subunit beta [Chloroflexi bacterium]|nr:indolepyruvate oxidoreductase subunit beta [Chloroflexota bacterium]